MERKPNTVLGLFALSIFIVSLYTFNYTKSLAGEIPDISSVSLLSSNNRSFNSDEIEIDYQTPSQSAVDGIHSTDPSTPSSSLISPPPLIAPNVASTLSNPQLQYPVPLPTSQSTSMPITSTSATEANHPAIANTSIQNMANSMPISASLKMVDPSSLRILSTMSRNPASSSNVIVNATPTEPAIPAPSSAVPVSASVPPSSLSTTNTSVQNTVSSSTPNLK